MSKKTISLMSGLAMTALASSQNAVIPRPQQMDLQEKRVKLSGVVTGATPDVVKTLGLVRTGGSAKVAYFKLNDANKPRGFYQISIMPKAVSVRYADAEGAYYAAQTLRQLLEPGQQLPWGEITDYPRFQWRGLHLDVSRHFFPVDFIKRQLDWMAALKMNIFHWHLTDDGGWRMEVKKYPKLTSVGAWRVDTGGKWPGGEWNQGNLQFIQPGMTEKAYGGFYTQAQIRDVVQYAAERHITIVPEIELPGHELAVTVSYPELACDNVAPADKPGKNNSNVLCAGKEETFKFLFEVLDETCDLFPSQWIHIGGDEVWKGHWNNCPLCQKRIKDEGLKDADELQSYFIRRIEKHLNERGRRMIGWDEILEGGLAPNATVMSWRGIAGGIAAAKARHDVVMSPTSHCYFDYSYSTIPTDLVYGYDPIPDELSPEEARHVLGVQGNVWTEWIPTEERAEAMTFPRGLAMAEIGWTNPDRKDLADFEYRMSQYIPWMHQRGIAFMLPTPKMDSQLEMLPEGGRVELRAPLIPFVTCRYTTDGTSPTPQSKPIAGAFWIEKPSMVTLAYFDASGRKGDDAQVSVISAPEPTGIPASRGKLLRKSMDFQGKSLRGADFAGLGQPSEATSIDLSGFEGKENYALQFDGQLVIPTTGEYTLYLTSDDGSMMYVAGAALIDNDGLHAPQTKSATIRLRAGAYPLRIMMFQSGGAQSLKAEIAGPGLSRRPIAGDLVALP